MRWVKLRYNSKANTHRLGWKFWDLLTEDDTQLAMLRYVPDRGYDVVAADWRDRFHFHNKTWKSQKAAKDYTVAYFVANKLEEKLEN